MNRICKNCQHYDPKPTGPLPHLPPPLFRGECVNGLNQLNAGRDSYAGPVPARIYLSPQDTCERWEAKEDDE